MPWNIPSFEMDEMTGGTSILGHLHMMYSISVVDIPDLRFISTTDLWYIHINKKHLSFSASLDPARNFRPADAAHAQDAQQTHCTGGPPNGFGG